MSGKIVKVSGPLVVAEEPSPDAAIAGIVSVGSQKLMGEIVGISRDSAAIQVYEDTSGLRVGDEVIVEAGGEMLSVELGPGLLGNMFDGIQRPFKALQKIAGDTIQQGITFPALDRKRRWEFVPSASVGDGVTGGDIVGAVEETEGFVHKIMVPPDVSGVIRHIDFGTFTIEEPVCKVETPAGETVEITMIQKWPVRTARPVVRKFPPDTPLCTGQRTLDTLFPIAYGGAAAVTGAFGSGKTTLLQSLAKWAEADIVIYICCGERGSEMADLLTQLQEASICRTGIIANTADMPIAAREAAVYSGVTIAEYYRDMGYNTLVLTDSVTRLAEGLREISNRLGEMPGEEGYPAHLSARIAEFYERAGSVECLGGQRGSLTMIGAVSPPGGDLSEPVTQAVMRSIKAFWILDDVLACQRHFPAVEWFESYSHYIDALTPWYNSNFGTEFSTNRSRAMTMLRKAAALLQMAKRTGQREFSSEDMLMLETAQIIREDFLRQDTDEYSAYEQQAMLLSLILYYHEICADALQNGLTDVQKLFEIPARKRLGQTVASEEYHEQYRAIAEDMESEVDALIAERGGAD
ncbi:MAG: V-type ATP synthase subunit A [Oscillospiraceae bacterium]|nr:V-type ATP synthase subunit A [Oscillospiraceae bacterium]